MSGGRNLVFLLFSGLEEGLFKLINIGLDEKLIKT